MIAQTISCETNMRKRAIFVACADHGLEKIVHARRATQTCEKKEKCYEIQD